MKAVKRYNKAPEKVFEKELFFVSGLNRCLYLKIPDVSPTKEKVKDRKNFMFTEQKRPFDAVLITPGITYCIECKYGYAPLKEHQKLNLERINSISPGTGIVLRKIERLEDNGIRRIYVKYRKELDGEVILETDDPQKLIKSFLTTTDKGEQ